MTDVKTILKLLNNISKEERKEVYSQLGKIVKNERSGYRLTVEQKVAIKEHTEELYKNAKGEIPKYIFGHRSYHEEFNDNTWHN